MSMTWVNCERSPPCSRMPLRPVDDHRVAGAAEVRGDLLAPVERAVAGPGPCRRVVRPHHVAAPGLEAAPLERELELLLVGQRDPVQRRQLVERAGQRALHAGAVVAPDVDHEGVVELAHLLDRVDHAADVPVGVLAEARVHLHLPRVEAPLVRRRASPRRASPRAARCELCVGGDRRRAASGARRSPRAACPSPGRTRPCTGPTTRPRPGAGAWLAPVEK